MTDHITRLKEALEAGPTEGEWIAEIPDGRWARDAYIRVHKWGIVAHVGVDQSVPHWDGPQRANAAYIAAANPAAIRELLERLEQAEKDAARWMYMRAAGVFLDGHEFISYGEIADYRVDAAIASQEGDKQ